MFENTSLGSLEKTVEFATRRHAVLAGNIANMDTPGYQTRDLSVDDFQESLKALSTAKRERAFQSPGHQFSVLSPDGQIAMDGADAKYEQAVEHVFDAMRQVQYHDGSDDSLEVQVLEMSKNQSMHQMAIALLRSQFQTLKMAISESVNV